MKTEDLARELARTKLELEAAQTALEDIEEICDDAQDLKIENGEAVTFRKVGPEHRLKLIKRRLARHRVGQ